MEMQNVTLRLPRDLVRQARHVAVERGISLSKLLAECVERAIERDGAYEAAKARALRSMQEGIPMGVGAEVGWTRDELHER